MTVDELRQVLHDLALRGYEDWRVAIVFAPDTEVIDTTAVDYEVTGVTDPRELRDLEGYDQAHVISLEVQPEPGPDPVGGRYGPFVIGRILVGTGN